MEYIERATEGGKTTVIFRCAALYYYLMWPTILISFLAGLTPNSLFTITATLLWAVLISLALPTWSTIREIKRAMKNGVVRASGSKWSFSNPLRYEWETESKSLPTQVGQQPRDRRGRASGSTDWSAKQ